MLEKILGYSATPNKSSAHKSTKKIKAAIDLVAVTFKPSAYLWYGQLTIYAALLIFSFVGLLPFFLSLMYAMPLWLAFVVFIGIAIRKSYYEKNAQPLGFEIINNEWRLTTQTGLVVVSLAGEVVLWSWLIIIPVVGTHSNERYYLVVLPDSLEQQQWRRLRVWLKTCL